MPIVLKGKKNNIELQVPGCSGGEGAVTSVNGQTGVVVLDIPSKVSELENDAGYLTEHQSLDALATKEALNDGLAAKQDKLTAGANITIENNVISASGSGIGGTSNHAELSNLDFAHSGHTGFASTEDIPTKLSQLENDSQFITSASIPTKVSQLENDKNYATTSQIPTKISQLDNDKSYLTSTTADAQGYVKQTELDKKQDKLTAGSGITISDNNTIAATTTYTLPIAGQGQLGGVALYGHKDETDVYNNDFAINQSNGIIEMRPAEKVISKPDTMDQATYANYVRDFHLGGVKLKPTSLLTVDDDGYIDVYTAGLKSEIVPTNVGAFTNDAGYITGEAIPTVPTKVSELENDSNFITNSDIPTNVSYFTNDAGYLTEHQNLDAYATKTELATGLAEKQATLTAGANITIENNVISASASGGEPDAYIKSASVSGNTLTLTNKDDTTVAFTPSGGGGGGSSYTLPQASYSTLGGVKVVSNTSPYKDADIGKITISDDGVLYINDELDEQPKFGSNGKSYALLFIGKDIDGGANPQRRVPYIRQQGFLYPLPFRAGTAINISNEGIISVDTTQVSANNGVPSGGGYPQILIKNTVKDYDTAWSSLPDLLNYYGIGSSNWSTTTSLDEGNLYNAKELVIFWQDSGSNRHQTYLNVGCDYYGNSGNTWGSSNWLNTSIYLDSYDEYNGAYITYDGSSVSASNCSIDAICYKI